MREMRQLEEVLLVKLQEVANLWRKINVNKCFCKYITIEYREKH